MSIIGRQTFLMLPSFFFFSRKRDYYEILGVPYDADQHQINNAFIRKSQEVNLRLYFVHGFFVSFACISVEHVLFLLLMLLSS